MRPSFFVLLSVLVVATFAAPVPPSAPELIARGAVMNSIGGVASHAWNRVGSKVADVTAHVRPGAYNLNDAIFFLNANPQNERAFNQVLAAANAGRKSAINALQRYAGAEGRTFDDAPEFSRDILKKIRSGEMTFQTKTIGDQFSNIGNALMGKLAGTRLNGAGMSS